MADPTPSEILSQPAVIAAPVAASLTPPAAVVPPAPAAQVVSTPAPIVLPTAPAEPALAAPAVVAPVAAPPVAAAPVEPVYAIKAPQGSELDPEFMPAILPALKKSGITNEQLQTIAEGYIEFSKAIPQRMLARDLDITAKDPEIGGLRYAQTLREVTLALDSFADPEFKQFVQQAGIANRLAFVRVFQRIGSAMARAGDRPVRGEPDMAPAITTAQKLYGKTSPK